MPSNTALPKPADKLHSLLNEIIDATQEDKPTESLREEYKAVVAELKTNLKLMPQPLRSALSTVPANFLGLLRLTKKKPNAAQRELLAKALEIEVGTVKHFSGAAKPAKKKKLRDA